MTLVNEGQSYAYWTPRGNPSHSYLFPAVEQALRSLDVSRPRIIDVGSGNGAIAARISDLGFDVVGVEPSDDGIRIARESYPQIQFHQLSCYEDLSDKLGKFDLAVCLEVIEHLYSPASLAKTLASLLSPNGRCVVSTPFHGYAKYVALAVTGRMERHLNPLNEGGHIKFFTPIQLTTCLSEAGLVVDHIERVGRVPLLAKSMVATARHRDF